MWAALALNAMSGFLMFAGAALSYIPNSTFHAKVMVVLLAVVFGIIVQWACRNGTSCQRLPRGPNL